MDGLLGAPEPVHHHVAHGGRITRTQRHLLLPVLHAIQDRVGWVSRGALEYACRRLSIPPAEAYGVVSFYARFALEPRGEVTVHVCDDIVCQLVDAIDAPEGARRVPCLGLCDRAPATLTERFGAVYEAVQSAHPPFRQPGSKLLRRIGVVDPESIESYRDHGGFAALKRAREMGPAAIIRAVTEAGLLGRGGAAFPTGRKWQSVADQPVRPHYLVCNADESEPGTFKDRVLLENDPFALVEGMAIAAFATGCEKAYVYVRDEYPLARERVARAIKEAREHGYLDFDVEVRRGAGAYICGEETALFNSIEGKRGEPRNKPPFPVQVGLFGKPTLPNNVETLVNVLEVLTLGGEAYAQIGTTDSTGSRLFCLSGCVERPGVYEVEHGITLRELLETAGGVRGGKELKAILLGGAAGSFVTSDDLDLRLTFEDSKAAGVTLGSGVVMAFDEDVDLTDIVLRIAAFFRDESCGQCVPCRVGTVRQEEALARVISGRASGSLTDELALIDEIGQVMRDASICGLGQLAANAVDSAIHRLKIFDGGAA